MRHLLISVSYEGGRIAPSTIFAAIRDRLEEHDREPVEGKAWQSEQFLDVQYASVTDAWWRLTDAERSMIHDLYPQLHMALFVLYEAMGGKKLPRHFEVAQPSRMVGKDAVPQLTLEEIEAVVDKPSLTEGNPHYHYYNCPARLQRDVPCTCSEESYRQALAEVKIKTQTNLKPLAKDILSGQVAHSDKCVMNARVVTQSPNYTEGSDIQCICHAVIDDDAEEYSKHYYQASNGVVIEVQ